MGYSILKYGCPMLTDIDDLEQTKTEALYFIASMRSEYIEIRDSDNETVTIGYFDGCRFHWTKDKAQAEAWKVLAFITESSLWRSCSKPERTT